MNAKISSIVCIFSFAFAAVAGDNQPSQTVRARLKKNSKLRYEAAELEPCILQGLRRWTHSNFVIINWGQTFPPIKDIRHSGDGQYRMLFFSRLSTDTTLVCFQNNTGIGAAYHALFFSRRGERCE